MVIVLFFLTEDHDSMCSKSFVGDLCDGHCLFFLNGQSLCGDSWRQVLLSLGVGVGIVQV